MQKGLIYIIRNNINNKVYIGQTTLTMELRWQSHMKPSVHKVKGRYKLYNAMNKHGKENFYYEILENDIDVVELDQTEIDYIEKFNSYEKGYNSTKGGDGRVINNDYDVEKIISDYKSGISSAVIAKEYDVHSATICRILHANNIQTRPDGRKLTDDMKDEIITMARVNSYPKVAKYYQVDPKTIFRFLKKHGFSKKVQVKSNDYSERK